MREGTWIIGCRKCDVEGPASRLEDFTFRCHNCGTIWEEEGTSVYNVLDVTHYKALYHGAKIAGMIPELEFEGDREQQRRERW